MNKLFSSASAVILILVGMVGCTSHHTAVQMPGISSDSVVLLSNGWYLSPAGTSIELGDFPFGMEISPDGKHAVVVNSGQSVQTLSVVNVEKRKVVQTLHIKKSWLGIAWSPRGDYFFVSGGNDNAIYRYGFENDSAWFINAIHLGDPEPKEIISPAGIAVNSEGSILYAATKRKNSLYKLDAYNNTVLSVLEFSSPLYTAVLDEQRRLLYASLWGDSKVAVVQADSLKLVVTIAVGDHPCDLLRTNDGKRLFVANANNNTVSVIDLDRQKVIETISVGMSPDLPNGSTPNSLAIGRDQSTLYVANADNNFLAVLDIGTIGQSRSKGFIPTGWYPTVVRCVGSELLVVNGKGGSSKPNPHGEYIGGGLLNGTLSFIPLPSNETMARYTAQVFRNTPLTRNVRHEEWTESNPVPPSPSSRSPIKHLFYIIKENRTYDQVFGDLPRGNGDSSLCLFGRTVTPNHHALAEEFVLLDNFYCDAEVSADGHNWSMAAYATDYVEKTWPTLYGSRGGTYDFETEGISSPSIGYIWDACLRKGLRIRNYGEFLDEDISEKGECKINAKGLVNNTCPTYRGWDLRYMDVQRAADWAKEFDRYSAGDSLPDFQIIRLPQDHTAGTKRGSNSPRAMVADNDLALGTVIDKISHSKQWNESAVFVIEDDAQNGSDHVDAHRTVALVVSPYTKRKFVDHTMYSTSSMLRTMELILGIPPMSQFDASATPMYASFQAQPDLTPYTVRKNTIDLQEKVALGAYGQERMESFDLSKEDAAPDTELNEIIWKSVKGTQSEMPAAVRNTFVLIPSGNDQ